ALGAWGPIALGVVGIVLLVLRERVAPQPMLPLRLFGNMIFSMSCLITFLMSTVMVGLIIIVPIDYGLVGGLAANEAGARLIPMTFGAVMGSFFAGQCITRFGRYRIFPVTGTLTACLACLIVAYVGLGRSAVFDLGLTALLGLAFGFQLSPM